MSIIYAVSTVPVRDGRGDVVGWIRVDPLADGSHPTDMVILRDGSACGQEEAMKRVAEDVTLLYATREDAVRDGIQRLRESVRAGRAGALTPRRSRRRR